MNSINLKPNLSASLMIENGIKITTEAIRITPEIAAQMLRCNTRNRKLSKTNVEKYASAMKRGEWAFNGEPIIFSVTNVINEGQHRLHAVIRSGVSIDVLVIRGVSDEAFKTTGGGKPRTASDVLSIEGEVNTAVLGAAARSYLQYFMTGRATCEITNMQILCAVKEHPELRYWSQSYVSAKLRRFPSSIAGLLTIASERYGSSKLDELVEKLGSGIGLSAGDPALVLRERFARIKEKGMSLNHAQGTGFMIKAINAHIQGRKIGILRITPEESIPKII